jgi:ketosteroid isomerase-like protein
MRIYAIVAVLCALWSRPALGQADGKREKHHESAFRAVERVQDDLVAAYIHHDVAALDRLLADDYVFTNERGEVETKSQVLANFAGGGARTIISYVIDDRRVRVYGGAAVLTYHYTSEETYQGREDGGSFRITRVFVRRRGRWQIVAGHETRLPR